MGQDISEVKSHFGVPENTSTEDGKAIYSYLQGGLRIAESDGHIAYIELARSRPLLQYGTTAFVPRKASTLFISDFQGNDLLGIRDNEALKRYFAQVASARIVENREDADFILSGKLADLEEEKGEFLTEAIPLKYYSTVRLTYSIQDTRTGLYRQQNKEVKYRIGVDFTKDAIIGAAVLALIAAKNKNLQIPALLLGGLGISELQRAIKRAVNACPGQATRYAFNAMVEDVNKNADFAARVTAVDYTTGRITINIGSDQGIVVSAPNHPCEFELLIGGVPLPAKEQGISLDYCTARVVSVTPNECICELWHVDRGIDKRAKERSKESPALPEVRYLPDPTTGVLSARVAARFPEIPIIRDN